MIPGIRIRQGLLFALAALAAAWAVAAPTPLASHPGFVAKITLDGPIGPAAVDYYADAARRAQAEGARAIVLEMDTPGGLSSSMHDIVSAILSSPIPVLGYVAPDGARAASAGTYILYACHVAAMAPATHLGAATPVQMGAHTPMPAPREESPKPGKHPATAASSPGTSQPADTGGDAESHKVLNDAIAYIRSLAQLRKRNAAWAEQAVRGAATLTASEAVDKHVADFIADDIPSLLKQASGRRVQVGKQLRTLDLQGLSVRAYAPDWRARFLGIITNPTIAYILLMAGIYGLILEAFHPGAMFPGVTGAICLLIGLYAMHLLPVNYAGLALMGLGIGLILAEIFTATLGVLGIGGVASFLMGSIMLYRSGIPGYGVNLGVISGLAVSALVILGLIVWLVIHTRRSRVINGENALVDTHGEILEAVPAGGIGWARIHGERWRVCSDDALPLGTSVRVTAHDGLTLHVERIR